MSLIVDRSIFDPDTVTLYGSKCASCGSVHFPPRRVACPECFADDVVHIPLSGRGVLHAFTDVRLKDPGLVRPCVVGDIHLAEGVRLYAPIEMSIDFSELHTGMEVTLARGVVRHDPDGEEVIGYRFVPRVPAGPPVDPLRLEHRPAPRPHQEVIFMRTSQPRLHPVPESEWTRGATRHSRAGEIQGTRA